MSSLNKITLFIWLWICIQPIVGIRTDETPLFDPFLSAKSISLGKSANLTHKIATNMMQNPATIVDKKSIAMTAVQYFDIEYSSIFFTNQLYDTSIGFSYIGSSITDIERSSVENMIVKPVTSSIPYEYHALSIALAKSFGQLTLGVGGQLQALILDDTLQQKISQFFGFTFDISDELIIGGALQNLNSEHDKSNALQKGYPIQTIGASFKMSKRTNANISFIHNKNEISTHSTLHYGVEHYMNDYVPIRVGLDHNRYTFGTGLNFDPFEIDIGWAQSRHSVAEDQVTVTFTYGFIESNHLY
ncbi:MAG: hypothetical protein ACON35_05820 [Candidatus Marinamargulisbacteria bacterium]